VSATPPGTSTLTRARTGLLALAAVRGVLSLVALPLAPALYNDHFVFLVLLRPTKEVLLAGGFFVRRGDVSLLPIVVAAVPLMVFGVWLFYALGRAYADEIHTGEGLPPWAGRLLPRDRIQDLCRILDRKGGGVVVAGRLAAFPSSLLAAAAGVSGMEPSKFLPADALGAALSVVEVMVAGYVLGEAYEEAGPWLTGVGVAVLFGLLIVVGRWLKREGRKDGKGHG
jgi:membrane protein DedA with SNARE-associated domain